MEAQTVTLWIDDKAIARLEDKVSKLNTKARTWGVNPVTVTVTGKTKESSLSGGGNNIGHYHWRAILHEVIVTMTGVIALPGWDVCAVIDHRGKGYNIIHSLDDDNWSAYKEASSFCEHCNTNRKRNFTVILRSQDDGKIRKVGTTCVADYIGHKVPTAALTLPLDFQAALQAAKDDKVAPTEVSLHYVITKTCAQVRIDGKYVGRAYEAPTINTAMGFDDAELTSDDWDKAAKVIDWWRLRRDFSNDWEYKVSDLLENDYISRHHVGLAISSVAGYEYRDGKPKTEQINEHVGTIGEKITLSCKVVKVIACDTPYGTSWLHIFDCDGRSVKWFASKKVPLAKGETVTITGRVKAHENYRGTAQTMLTRCRVLD